MRGSRAVGSACVSRAGLKAWPSLRVRCSGVAPKHAFSENVIETKKMKRKGKSAIARTRSPACETHALPNHWSRLIGREYIVITPLVFLTSGAIETHEQENACGPSPASWRAV
ncbi:MAG: hypothetical protein DMF00_07710 [Verrucomicrobia bacterium]|nr:MAG: hypothetical protein DMF00_07710 [Verrucomicrobiota bacterium]